MTKAWYRNKLPIPRTSGLRRWFKLAVPSRVAQAAVALKKVKPFRRDKKHMSWIKDDNDALACKVDICICPWTLTAKLYCVPIKDFIPR